MLATAPDTYFDEGVTAELTTLSEVDGERVVRVFGGGGTFVEADGTTYTASGGAPTGTDTASSTGASLSIDVAGVRVDIDGPTERTYTVHVFAE